MAKSELTPWSSLDDDARIKLRMAHEAWLDSQPPTCSLDTKMTRFVHWLAGRGVSFKPDRDLKPAGK